MRKIAFVPVVLAMMTVHTQAQDDRFLDLRAMGIKEFPVQFATSTPGINHDVRNISTESAKDGDQFTAILSRALVDTSGHVLALDGSRVGGVVLKSHNWDSPLDPDWDFEPQRSFLALSITTVENRDGRISVIATEGLIFESPGRPSKKSVVGTTLATAFRAGFLGMLGGKYGAVFGTGFGTSLGLVEGLKDRNLFVPKPARTRQYDNWVKTARILKVR